MKIPREEKDLPRSPNRVFNNGCKNDKNVGQRPKKLTPQQDKKVRFIQKANKSEIKKKL